MSNAVGHSKQQEPMTRILGILKRSVYWMLMLVVVTGAYLHYKEEIPEPLDRIQRISMLEQERDLLAAKSARLSRRIEWLKDPSDPSYLVIEAREKLGMQRDDEVIIRLEDVK
jgi:cell division protein FtsB